MESGVVLFSGDEVPRISPDWSNDVEVSVMLFSPMAVVSTGVVGFTGGAISESAVGVPVG